MPVKQRDSAECPAPVSVTASTSASMPSTHTFEQVAKARGERWAESSIQALHKRERAQAVEILGLKQELEKAKAQVEASKREVVELRLRLREQSLPSPLDAVAGGGVMPMRRQSRDRSIPEFGALEVEGSSAQCATSRAGTDCKLSSAAGSVVDAEVADAANRSILSELEGARLEADMERQRQQQLTVKLEQALVGSSLQGCTELVVRSSPTSCSMIVSSCCYKCARRLRGRGVHFLDGVA